MSVKTDSWIQDQVGMISPFAEGVKRKGIISYGLGSMGYDFRLDDVFWVDHKPHVISPKRVSQSDYEEVRASEYVLMPGSYVLGKSVEYFQMPDDILGICYGKSSYARCGVLLNMTPIEPGWCGYLTMAIANVGRSIVKLHAYEGIGQIVFHNANEVPLTTYATKEGKYQGAQGMMAARVD